MATAPFAVEEKNTRDFLGYIGICPVPFEAAFVPATEIGWRLARSSWGRGYASEGARAVVGQALGRLGFAALVSFTAEWNMRSRRGLAQISQSPGPPVGCLRHAWAPRSTT